MKRITAVLLSCATGAASAADITVSAAASLNNAFREAAAVYEAAHPGDKVLLNFAASDALVAQIAKGAPVDLFASADQEAMDKAQAHVVPGSRRDFASNRLVVAVPFGSRLDLRTLADLRQPAVQRLTTGNPASVPAGRYTKGALEKQDCGASWSRSSCSAPTFARALITSRAAKSRPASCTRPMSPRRRRRCVPRWWCRLPRQLPIHWQ